MSIVKSRSIYSSIVESRFIDSNIVATKAIYSSICLYLHGSVLSHICSNRNNLTHKDFPGAFFHSFCSSEIIVLDDIQSCSNFVLTLIQRHVNNVKSAVFTLGVCV